MPSFAPKSKRSKTMRKHIAVLVHESDRDRDLSGYLIWLFADLWREDGLAVRLQVQLHRILGVR